MYRAILLLHTSHHLVPYNKHSAGPFAGESSSFHPLAFT